MRGGRGPAGPRQERRTVPYVLLRCEIRCDWDDTERETEDDKLEKYSRAADGTNALWMGEIAGAGRWLLTLAQQSVYMPVQKHPARSFFARYVCVCSCGGGVGQALRRVPVCAKLEVRNHDVARQLTLALACPGSCAQSPRQRRRHSTSRHVHEQTTATSFRIEHDGQSHL